MKIPVTVLLVTKNEEKNIAACLAALSDFDEVIVVDSYSQDRTKQIVEALAIPLIEFRWNGAYPKKRQWCLDTLALKHDFVFFVDTDEIVSPALVEEMRTLFNEPSKASGYFVKGRHSLQGKILKHGLQNHKLALFDRQKMQFPVIGDLDIPGMGEIEGHYQPVFKPGFERDFLSSLRAPLIHRAMEDSRAWIFRHQKYARWECGMNEKNAWPKDPKPWREHVKSMLRKNKFRPQIMFFIGYIFLLGFLDGREGLQYARNKREYYKLIH